MAHDEGGTIKTDQSVRSSEAPYDLRFFAKKHGISKSKADAILKEYGPGRASCDAAVEKVRRWK